MKIHAEKFMIGMLVIALVGFGFSPPSTYSTASAYQESKLLAEVTEVQQVYPLLNPSTVSCNSYWEAIPTSNGSPAFITLNVNNPASSANSAEWRPSIPQSGLYRVEVYVPAPPPSVSCSLLSTASQNTTKAVYQVHHANGAAQITLNQSSTLNTWISLGSFQFSAGTTNYIELTDLNSESNLTRFVVFSALRFIPQDREYTIFFPRVSREIPPVVAKSSVVMRQRQAFDSCIRPTLSGLQAWWNSSPYYIYNIYMGGISNTSCHPETLTASWISSVHNQGWEFIPTWVGPQAPCTTFKYRFSLNAQNAFGEGVSEANQAFNRAVSLGLAGSEIPKTVIYYDMEAFYGATTECREATKSFLSGWSQRLHELGARAGVYGSSCYYMPDWKALSNPLDDAWLASWYKIDHDGDDNTEKRYFYDPYANVWSVLCSGSLTTAWTNHQRIRQYAGGHNETWGGVTVNIDGNITDGNVFSPSGATTQDTAMDQPVAAFSSVSTPAIDLFQLVAPRTGWVLQDERLLWTEDGGATWEDRTPAFATADFVVFDFIGVHFDNVQAGWAVVRTAGEDLVPSLEVIRTTNSGQTWITTGVPVSPELASQVENGYFDFIDGSTGWLSLELGSSSAFKPGILFMTRDGGDAWQDLTIPIGEPVNFITSQVGWTAGGPAGDEFYVSRDGGITWQEAAFIQDGPGMVNYSLPEFSDPLNGTILVTIQEEGEPRLEQYATQNSGVTWELVGLVPLGSQIQPGTTVPSDVTDTESIVAADSAEGLLYSSEDPEIHPLSLSSSSLPEGVTEIHFINELEGWLKTVNSSCSGVKSTNLETTFSCSFDEALWETQDGGLTWQQIR